jgi:hypothetical protein
MARHVVQSLIQNLRNVCTAYSEVSAQLLKDVAGTNGADQIKKTTKNPKQVRNRASV